MVRGAYTIYRGDSGAVLRGHRVPFNLGIVLLPLFRLLYRVHASGIPETFTAAPMTTSTETLRTIHVSLLVFYSPYLDVLCPKKPAFLCRAAGIFSAEGMDAVGRGTCGSFFCGAFGFAGGASCRIFCVNPAQDDEVLLVASYLEHRCF